MWLRTQKLVQRYYRAKVSVFCSNVENHYQCLCHMDHYSRHNNDFCHAISLVIQIYPSKPLCSKYSGMMAGHYALISSLQLLLQWQNCVIPKQMEMSANEGYHLEQTDPEIYKSTTVATNLSKIDSLSLSFLHGL